MLSLFSEYNYILAWLLIALFTFLSFAIFFLQQKGKKLRWLSFSILIFPLLALFLSATNPPTLPEKNESTPSSNPEIFATAQISNQALASQLRKELSQIEGDLYVSGPRYLEIRKGAVGSREIKNGSIKAKDLDEDLELAIESLKIKGDDGYLNFGSKKGDDGYGIRNNNGTLQFKNENGTWADLGTGGGGGAETDPVFLASSASGITAGNLANWSTAYGWGNHAGVGYITDLTSFTSDDLAEGSTNLYSQWINDANGIGYLAGNVGIGGASSPIYALDVNGNLNVSGIILINGAPFAGGGSQWITSGSNIYYDVGNVGIGTAADPNHSMTFMDVGGSNISYFDVTDSGITIKYEAGQKSALGLGDGFYWENELVSGGNNGISATGPNYSGLEFYTTAVNGSGDQSSYYFHPDFSNLNTAGDGYTALKVNATDAQAGADGNRYLMDLQVNGGSRLVVDSQGRLMPIMDNANTFIGEGIGMSNVGVENLFIGHYAGNSNVDGNSNIFLGAHSGRGGNTGSDNVFIGSYSGINNTGSNSVFIGKETGYSNTTGSSNFFGGYQAGYSNTDGSDNMFIGNQAGYNKLGGSSSVLIGSKTGFLATNLQGALLVGRSSGYSLQDGLGSSFLGYYTGSQVTTGTENTYVGSYAGRQNFVGSYNVAIGKDALKGNSITGNATNDGGSVIVNSPGHNLGGGETIIVSSDGSTGTGLYNGTWTVTVDDGDNFHLDGASYVGDDPNLKWQIDYGAPSQNTAIGYQSGYSITGGTDNAFVGYQSGYSNTTGSSNFFGGYQAGYANTTGGDNVFIGSQAGYANTTGRENFFLGSDAGYWNTTGTSNVFLGNLAGEQNSTGNLNLFLGSSAGKNNMTGGANIFIGNNAGANNTAGSSNIAIGRLALYETNISAGPITGMTDGSPDLILTSPGHGLSGGEAIIIRRTDGIDGDYAVVYVDGDTFKISADGGATNVAYAGDLTWDDSFWSVGPNLAIGSFAGQNTTSGYGNSFIGFEAGKLNTTGTNNFFGGYQAGYSNSGGRNNVFLGNQAGYSNTGGSWNVFIGYQAGYLLADAGINSNNLFLGSNAGDSLLNGHSNTFIGDHSGDSLANGSYNFFMGSDVAYDMQEGSYNLFLGKEVAGTASYGTENILIGDFAGDSSNYISRLVGLGVSSLKNFNATNGGITAFADAGGGEVTVTSVGHTLTGGELITLIGTTNYNGDYTVNTVNGDDFTITAAWVSDDATGTWFRRDQGFNTAIGYEAGKGEAGGGFSGSYNNFFGYQAGLNISSGSKNDFIGYQSGYSNTTGSNNFFGGYQAGYSNIDGNNSVMIGSQAGYNYNSNEATYGSVLIGNKAGYSTTTGESNVFIGFLAGYENTTGDGNFFMGSGVGANNTTGDSNVFIGAWAGDRNVTGSNNLFLGEEAGNRAAFGSYNTFIGPRSMRSNTQTNGLGSITDDGNGKVYFTGPHTFAGGELIAFSDQNRLNLSPYQGISGTVTDPGDGSYFVTDINYIEDASVYWYRTDLDEGMRNTAIGFDAGRNNMTGSDNLIVGNNAGYGVNNTSNYTKSVFIGPLAGYSTTTGSFNTALGYEAGYSQTDGEYNVFLGYRAGYNETGSNKLYIENSASSTPLIYGDFTDGSELVTVNGQLGATDGLVTKVNAGACSDALFNLDTNGLICIDDTEDSEKIYFRANDEWYYVSKTGGFLIPDYESFAYNLQTKQYNQTQPLQAGDILLPFVDKYLSDGNVHGLYARFEDLKPELFKEEQEQIQNLNLQTNQNITTLEELQASIDENLNSISNQFSGLKNKNQEIEDQIEELKVSINSQLSTLNSQLSLNSKDIEYIKLLLGTDRVASPADIDILGQLSAKSIIAGSFVVKNDTAGNETIGAAKIIAGEKSIVITTTAVKTESKIFLTPKASSAIKNPLTVLEIKDGESFEVGIAEADANDIQFDWWIVATD